MADELWSKHAFTGGYSSGTILGPLCVDDPETGIRLFEDKRIGGSLSEFFMGGVKPLLRPDFRVLELGPGKGSWTRALFSVITQGEIHTIDLQDIRPWVKDLIALFSDRFFIHQVAIGEKDYNFIPDNYFDAFFSFGVFCHMNLDELEAFLSMLRTKLKKGSICIAQYSDWQKGLEYCLDPEGYEHNREVYLMLEEEYRFEFAMIKCKKWYQKLRPLWNKYVLKRYPSSKVSAERCFWVKNNKRTMKKILRRTGYEVINMDMGFFRRDPVVLFKPSK